MAPATGRVVQILRQLIMLVMTEGAITNYLLRHGIPISLLLAGKVLTSIYKMVTTALGGTDPDNVIADTILMACAWIFIRTCLLDWNPEINSFRLLTFSLPPKLIGFLVLLTTFTFAYAIWCLISVFYLSFWLGTASFVSSTFTPQAAL
ncbi:hypothetical protein C8R42DRAFT_730101 [Lentinula raphanica]|nr:hypothetical protein C8R42DRAFT_730101 [Lentinula raphanica]